MLFGKQPEKPRPIIRCLTVGALEDSALIGEDLSRGNVVVFSFRDLRIRNPVEAKRLIQQVKAYVMRFDARMVSLGQNLILACPASHSLDISDAMLP